MDVARDSSGKRLENPEDKKKGPNPPESNSPVGSKPKEKKRSPDGHQSPRHPRLEERSEVWAASYVESLSADTKETYGKLVARNKRLKQELEAIVDATQQVIVKEK